MTVDPRLQAIRAAVADVAETVGQVAGQLERAQRLAAAYPDVLEALRHLGPMVEAHRDQLVACLDESRRAEARSGKASHRTGPGAAAALSEVLRDLSLAFQRCALNYAVLYEVALRLYEPRVREFAPKHLKAHAGAALATARLLPGVVALQLARDGLPCACICPMCGLGACGCVDLGTETLIDAWHDAAPTASGPPGFALLPPRPDSALARAGVQGGDLVLAVDGQRVQGRQDVQDAVRKHALGEELRVVVQRGAEAPRAFVVRHVSDYPKA